MNLLRIAVVLLMVQIAMLSLGLGQPWTNPPSTVCAVSAQYPMLLALFVHLVALVCTAVKPYDGQALVLIILALIGLAIPLPIGLYFYLYQCAWTNVVWCSEMLLNGVLIACWWWIPTLTDTIAVADSPSVSEHDEFTNTV